MPGFRNVLIPVDLALSARRALLAAEVLRAHPGAAITLLHVIEPLPVGRLAMLGATDLEGWAERAQRDAREELAELADATLPGEGGIYRKVRLGQPAQEILLEAGEMNADLIVLPTRAARGLRRIFLGSVAEEVFLRADRPVLTVQETRSHRELPTADEARSLAIGSILVPTDFSDLSRRATRIGMAIAGRVGAELHLLHVVDERGGDTFFGPGLGVKGGNVKNQLEAARKRAQDALLEEIAAHREETIGIEASAHALLGHPAKEIAAFATGYDVDLIVMGSLGRTGLADLFVGSTAERVARLAPCPVLTIRQGAAGGAGVAEAAGASAGERS